MGAYIEVYYNSRSSHGPSYSSGTHRLYEAELGQWLVEQMVDTLCPVLVTRIVVIRGQLGQLCVAK